MRCRLQNIMAAVLDQTAADEYNVTNSINTAKFADSVNQKQRIMRSFTLYLQKAGAQTSFQTILTSQLGYFLSAGNFARCDDQSGVRINFAYFLKSFKEGFFFSRMSTAGHNNRKTVFNTQFFFITSQIFRCNFGIGLVKFGVTGNQNFALVSTEMTNVFGINGRLHAKAADAAQHIFQNAV